jgi:hypothetical protein
LIGLLIDVSGSMLQSAIGGRAETISRLQAFQEAFADFAKKTKTAMPAQNMGGAVQVFAYGFGFGGPLEMIAEQGLGGPFASLAEAFLGGSKKVSKVRDLLADGDDAPTVSINDLADNWEQYKTRLLNLGLKMGGSTPMAEGFDVVIDRFHREEEKGPFAIKILFVLSDGMPDGEPFEKVREDIISKAEFLKAIILL